MGHATMRNKIELLELSVMRLKAKLARRNVKIRELQMQVTDLIGEIEFDSEQDERNVVQLHHARAEVDRLTRELNECRAARDHYKLLADTRQEMLNGRRDNI